MEFRRYVRVACLLAGFAACAALSIPAANAADLLSKIKQSGVLVIGTSNDAPLSYIDASTKQAAGVLPDILREFLKRENIKASIEVQAMPFASLIPAVRSNRIDLMGDAMYIRPARQQVMDFTDVVFYNPELLDVPKGNPLKLHSLADLCGHAAGSYEGTVYIDMLKKQSAACPAGKSIDVKQYPDDPECVCRSRGGPARCRGGGWLSVGLRHQAESRAELRTGRGLQAGGQGLHRLRIRGLER